MAYPDAVALVVAYLDGLHVIPVAARVPSPRPAEFIHVRQVGGAWEPPVRDSVRLDVFCWSTTEPAAFTLGELVRREIHLLAGTTTLGPVCYRVQETLSPRQFDDPLGVPSVYARWASYALLLRADDAVPYH